MNNKKDDNVIWVIFIAIVITQIISFKLDVDGRSLGYIVGGIALIIHYFITNKKG